jgi:flagellin
LFKQKNPADPPYLEVDAFFGTESGADWPDMNIVSPNGEVFGYNSPFLNLSNYQEDTTNSSSTRATYNGYAASDEKFTFENPISGKWYIEVRHDDGLSPSTI